MNKIAFETNEYRAVLSERTYHTKNGDISKTVIQKVKKHREDPEFYKTRNRLILNDIASGMKRKDIASKYALCRGWLNVMLANIEKQQSEKTKYTIKKMINKFNYAMEKGYHEPILV